MKTRYGKFGSLIIILAAVALSGTGSTAATKLTEVQKQEIKGQNDTGCLEVMEARRGATECKQSGSLSIRIKVNCDKPVDVRACIKTAKGAWSCTNYSNKKAGDELSYYECKSGDRYALFKRDAGSNAPWPNP